MTRAPWLSVCLLTTMACGDPEILGETACATDRAEDVDCAAVTLLEAPSADGKVPVEFDVFAQERRLPTWTRPLFVPPEFVHRGQRENDLALAPDGGVWVAQFQNRERALMQLDEAGEELRDSALSAPWPSDYAQLALTASSTVQPLYTAIQPAQLTGLAPVPTLAYAIQGGRRLEAVALPPELQPHHVVAGHGDAIVAVTAARDGQPRLHQLGRDGIVRATHAVERPVGFGAVAPALGMAPQIATAPDGSTLLSWYVADPTYPAPFNVQLLTLLDAQGTVKRHMRFLQHATITALATGEFAVTVAFEQGFRLYVIDADAKLRRSWTGLPAAYHGGTPGGITSDADGNVYIAMVTGLRQTPSITVCKLDAEVTSRAPRCFNIDLSSLGLPHSNGNIGGARVDAIVSPRPNTLVVAYATSPTPAPTGRYPYVSRLDF